MQTNVNVEFGSGEFGSGRNQSNVGENALLCFRNRSEQTELQICSAKGPVSGSI